jgi:hypothetical protein
LQSVYPINIKQDKYLFDYLQETNLSEQATWFTPLCSSNSNSNVQDSLSSVFSIVSAGITADKVKKYIIITNYLLK